MKAFSLSHIWRAGFLLAVPVFCAIQAQAQTAAPLPSAADENYELNIVDQRTNAENYVRSTAVGAANANVSVGIGASVGAQNIAIRMRGVTGSVRFRASLEALQQRIEKIVQTLPAQKTDNN